MLEKSGIRFAGNYQQRKKDTVNSSPCYQPYQWNYYHFVAEVLPRIVFARDLLLRDPQVLLLLFVNKHDFSWVRLIVLS